MEKIQITIKNNSKVIIGEHITNVDKYINHEKTIIITDKNISKYYSKKLPKYPIITIETGEKIKTLLTISTIVEKLIALQADRSTFLLGVGGGIVCDITGFVASIYMRGVKFGFIATSLLAQVDAAIGGKNGVNFNSYKNILGNINQPQFVICDTQMLKTLPQKEITSAMAEIVKYAIIADEKLFSFIDENANGIYNLNNEIITQIIATAVKIKAEIVNIDENETGERKKLNFGHTIGHAIEANYPYTHGQCVSIGMVFATHFSMQKGFIENTDFIKVKTLLNKLMLPTSIKIDKHKIIDAIIKDKKKNSNNIDFIFINKLGSNIIIKISIDELKTAINEYNWE